MSGDFIDSIACLYSGTVRKEGGSYVVDVPEREIRLGDIEEGSTVRIAILDDGDEEGNAEPRRRRHTAQDRTGSHPEPPVEEGDVREVRVESTGDQGDGIAKIDRGFVVIVPDAAPGDEVTVEIETVQPNYAVGQIVEESSGQLW
ncbi:MAG: TRAM domain-containing protein [Halanaeroarchaeum sp.]